MSDHFKDVKKIQDLLHDAQTGLWAIEIEEGKPPRMYANDSMLELLGLDGEQTPEECYRWWYERIEDDYYPMVNKGVEKLSSNERAELQYPWMHPQWGQIYVRCGGVRDWSYREGICLIGYHQNITNTVMLKQEYDTVIETLSEDYKGIFLCNLRDKKYRIIKMPDRMEKYSQVGAGYDDFFNRYAKEEVAWQNRKNFLDMVDAELVRRRLADGDTGMETFYRNQMGSWGRIRVLPLKQYSEDYPWIIVAMDDQDGEMEKRINDAAAQAAVSQMYRLVISVDMLKTEYNCIYYSGDILNLSRHGRYEDFFSDLARQN